MEARVSLPSALSLMVEVGYAGQELFADAGRVGKEGGKEGAACGGARILFFTGVCRDSFLAPLALAVCALGSGSLQFS